jgi:hypothetical protein
MLIVALIPGSLEAAAQTTPPPPKSPVRLYGAVALDPAGAGAATPAGLEVNAVDPQAASTKRGELVLAPLPMINPTLDNGLALVGGYVYRIDRTDLVTPPSFTIVAGFKTSNDSWGTAFAQKLNLMHDRVRLLTVVAYGDVNYEFFGIGEDAGDAGQSIKLNQRGPFVLTDALVRVGSRWYSGARYQILDMSVAAPDVSGTEDPVVPADDLKLRTAGLGPRLQFDSRDSQFYPRHGVHVDAFASFYGSAVGGRRTDQAWQTSISHFLSAGTRNVVAWHGVLCGVEGPAPFYDLCALGKSQDLRGYPIGQYRDSRMVAAQVEWRSEVWWRFGAVLFTGVGAVTPDFSEIAWDSLQPSGGAGLRFTLATRNHVNLRVDYAWGRKSSALYVSVAEAF